MPDSGKTPPELGPWLTPRVALAIVAKSFADDIPAAATAIVGRLKGASLRSIAVQCSFTRGRRDPHVTHNVEIPARHWAQKTGPENKYDFWASGDTSIFLGINQGETENVRYFGIKLETDGVLAMVPEDLISGFLATRAATKTPEPLHTAYTNKGGRPRKEFWDDLLIAIFEKMWGGDFTPKHQSDIEKAMLDWASENGHRLGDTSVKEPARKLFLLLRK